MRTRNVIEEHEIQINDNLILTDPLGYKDFMGLMANSKFVMTDSGGVQEESVVLNIPCLILRDSTEWMSYVELGKNILLGTDQRKIADSIVDLLDNERKLDDMKQIDAHIKGGTSENIVSILKMKFNLKQ